jgi:hypothetical protein
MALRGLPAILKVWDRIIKESGLQSLSLFPVRDPIALVAPNYNNICPARYIIEDLEYFNDCYALVGYVGEGNDSALFMLRTVPCDYVIPFNLRGRWELERAVKALKAIKGALELERQYGLRFVLTPLMGASYDGVKRIYGVQQMQCPPPLGTVILWRDEPTIFAVTPNRTIPIPLPLSDIEFHPDRVEQWIKVVTLDAYLECK